MSDNTPSLPPGSSQNPPGPGPLPNRREPADVGASRPWHGDDPKSVDWRSLGFVLWRRKWWIAAATALGVAMGFYLYSSTQPVYETQATIWLETANDDQGPIQASEVFRGRGWSDLFTTYAVLEPVVQETKLYLGPAEARTRRSELFSDLELEDDLRSGRYVIEVEPDGRYALRRDGDGVVEEGRLTSGPVGASSGFRWHLEEGELEPGTSLTFTLSSPAQAAARVRQNMSIIFDPRAGNLIVTRFNWPDPGEAARIHNGVVQSFMETARGLKNQNLNEVVDILERQEDYAAARLDSAELALENFRVNAITLPAEPEAAPIPGGETTRGPVFDAYFDRKLEEDRLQADLRRLRNQLEQAPGEEGINALALRMIPVTQQSPSLTASLDDLTQKQAQRQSLLRSYTPQHPDVQQVEQEIRRLKQQTIPAEVRDLVTQLEDDLAATQQEIEGQTRELRQIPTRTIQEARLRREMQMAEQLHQDLLSRLNQARLAAQTNLTNLEVVDRARPPESPQESEAARRFLLASLAGLGLGLGGVLLYDRFDERVNDPEEVQRALGLPILAMVPRIRSDAEPDSSDSLEVVEAFRTLRGQLVRRGRFPGAILVTSPGPREGKSLISANLAIAFATAGQRTLLIDTDIRRGNVDRLFEVSDRPGLTDFLQNGTRLDEVLRETEVENLTVIPHGQLRTFNANNLESDRMRELMATLRNRYDVVIADGQPLVTGIDPMTVGELCGQALLVLRSGGSNQETARSKLADMREFQLSVVGVVLNDVPNRAPYYTSYYYSYPRIAEAEVVS